MADQKATRARDDHDWHSLSYVDQWIARDVGRDSDRRPALDKMMGFANFATDRSIRVLDVASGYGAVTQAVFRAFPKAEVTMQDFSRQMLDRARERLSPKHPGVTYVRCDLAEPGWNSRLAGSYDLVVSSIGIHNLDDPERIGACYKGIFELLARGGKFLNADYFSRAGGVPLHVQLLEKAGFGPVDCPWTEDKQAILRAIRQS